MILSLNWAICDFVSFPETWKIELPNSALGNIVLQSMGARQLHMSVSSVVNYRGIENAMQRALSENGRGTQYIIAQK